MSIYVDSSFLASLYTVEVHSPAALRSMAQKPLVWLTHFNRTELAHAFYFQVFRSRITPLEARRAWENFQQDCSAGVWTLVNLPDAIWETSVDLARRYGPALGVRTLDSLHVACALELGAKRFWTFDERQEKLAEAVGLDTNP